jgi:Bacterial TSP3 repeat
VQFRWRFGSDSSTGSTGWSVDTVQVSTTNYACTSIDADGDGIPDGYETQHGLDPMNMMDAALDNDGDGRTNLEEYLAGTDPQDAASVLQIISTSQDSANGNVTITFPSVNGVHYRVEFNSALTNPGGWATLLSYSDVVGTGGPIAIVDTSAAGQPERFYRIRPLLP